jgi:hypothetical protein
VFVADVWYRPSQHTASSSVIEPASPREHHIAEKDVVEEDEAKQSARPSDRAYGDRSEPVDAVRRPHGGVWIR